MSLEVAMGQVSSKFISLLPTNRYSAIGHRERKLSRFILFFRHSLLATHLVSEINENLGVQLCISDILQHSTLYSLAGFIENPTETSSDITLDLLAVVERHSQGNAL
jgi:hypothetical protein